MTGPVIYVFGMALLFAYAWWQRHSEQVQRASAIDSWHVVSGVVLADTVNRFTGRSHAVDLRGKHHISFVDVTFVLPRPVRWRWWAQMVRVAGDHIVATRNHRRS